MKFAAPLESKKRKRMVLAKGMKIVTDDSYQKFSEDEFKEHLASILDSPEESLIPRPGTDSPSSDPMGAGTHHDGSDGFNEVDRSGDVNP
jgi:hypothetical protein